MKQWIKNLSLFAFSGAALVVVACGGSDDFPAGGNPGTAHSSAQNSVAAKSSAMTLPLYVMQIVNGNVSSAALMSDGTVRWWGLKTCAARSEDNCSVEVGQDQAETVPGLQNMRQIALGDEYLCALGRDEAVTCVNRARFGSFGDDRKLNFSLDDRPITLTELANVGDISIMDHTACARRHNGDVYCWGDLAPAPELEMTPTRVNGIDDALRIAVSRGAACAIVMDGTVKCWGRSAVVDVDNQKFIEFYDPPTTVEGISDAISLAANDLCFHVIIADGTVKRWEAADILNKSSRRAGLYVYGAGPLVSEVLGVTNASAIESGPHNEACAVLKDGTVSCWYWVLVERGDRYENAVVGPIPVKNLKRVSRFYHDMRFAYAILADSTAISFDAEDNYWKPLWQP